MDKVGCDIKFMLVVIGDFFTAMGSFGSHSDGICRVH
jgi:hypothetical protein